MTVRILTAWNGFPSGFVGEVRAPDVEEWLVNIGFATYELGDPAPAIEAKPMLDPEKSKPNKAAR